MRRRRVLSPGEAELWDSVSRSVRPLRGRRARIVPAPPAPEPEPPAAPAPAGAPGPAASSPKRPSVHPVGVHAIERPVARKLARGRLGLDGRIDLHDMSLARAHDALLAFLRQAQAAGLRHVLVVTGRAGPEPSGRGIIRRQIAHWLAKPDFAALVAGLAPADRRHGGEGALYLRIRRAGAP